MSRQDQVNQSCYSAERIASSYLRSNLQMPEVMIFMKYHGDVWGSKLLDIGCGAGRTAVFLSRWAGEYKAVDYAEGMVRLCRQRCPGVDVSAGDVRDLSRFADGSFDTVVFANNGFDSLIHEDRITGLSEMSRVLRSGGLFVFSTHNSDYPLANRQPNYDFTLDPCAAAKRFVRFWRCSRNRWHNMKYERTEEKYRIINDPAHHYGLVTYYISVQDQIAQLADAGLEFQEVYDLHGKVLDPSVPDKTCSWLWYVARKR